MAEHSNRAETHAGGGLLGTGDPPPLEIVNETGASRVVLSCEHAGRAVPGVLGDLGVPAVEMERHIAYDVGAAPVARQLSHLLDAPLFLQPYSRLVVDCNRPLDAPDCFPEVSDGTPIPANAGLDPTARRQRYDEIHQPFHAAIASQLDARDTAETPAVLIAVHSFTPRLAVNGTDRPWHIGLLHSRDVRFARTMMAALEDHAQDILAAFNQPYTVDDAGDYTIPVHGERRGVANVLLEIRSDLIGTTADQLRWAEVLNTVISDALTKVGH